MSHEARYRGQRRPPGWRNDMRITTIVIAALVVIGLIIIITQRLG